MTTTLLSFSLTTYLRYNAITSIPTATVPTTSLCFPLASRFTLLISRSFFTSLGLSTSKTHSDSESTQWINIIRTYKRSDPETAGEGEGEGEREQCGDLIGINRRSLESDRRGGGFVRWQERSRQPSIGVTSDPALPLPELHSFPSSSLNKLFQLDSNPLPPSPTQ